MTTYRAAYILPAPGSNSAGVVLTLPEDAGLSDDDLMTKALAEVENANIGPIPRERIEIGEWRE